VSIITPLLVPLCSDISFLVNYGPVSPLSDVHGLGLRPKANQAKPKFLAGVGFGLPDFVEAQSPMAQAWL